MRLVRHAARALSLAAAVLAGCGEGAEPNASGPLQWKDTPFLTVAAESLPDDRILAGTVVNVGFGRELELDATKIVVRDANGTKLEAFGLWSHTYAHGLYGASEAPDGPLGEDRRRLGFVRKVRVREEAPLTVAYRLTPKTKPPLTIEYGEGRLPVPPTLTEDRE
jgi:hypothetical protein